MIVLGCLRSLWRTLSRAKRAFSSHPLVEAVVHNSKDILVLINRELPKSQAVGSGCDSMTCPIALRPETRRRVPGGARG